MEYAMSEYVPGPWRVSSDGRYVAVLGNDYQIVANVLGEPRTVNAQLISAAPDMYAALKAMLSPDAEGDIDMAIAAIRKAEGLQS
jgi:hypothetical protein